MSQNAQRVAKAQAKQLAAGGRRLHLLLGREAVAVLDRSPERPTALITRLLLTSEAQKTETPAG